MVIIEFVISFTVHSAILVCTIDAKKVLVSVQVPFEQTQKRKLLYKVNFLSNNRCMQVRSINLLFKGNAEHFIYIHADNNNPRL